MSLKKETVRARLADNSNRYVFIPGGLPTPEVVLLHNSLHPAKSVFDKKSRAELNKLAEYIIGRSVSRKVDTLDGSFQAVTNTLSYLASNPSQTFVPGPIQRTLSSLWIEPVLPTKLKISEIVARSIRNSYVENIDETIRQMRITRDPAFNRYEKLIAVLNAASLMDSTAQALYFQQQAEPQQPFLPESYIFAGVNEGLAFILTTLESIPPALARYNQSKGLPKPQPEDVFKFAANQGLRWIKLHQTPFKDPFFSLMREVTERYYRGVFLTAPPLNKPVIAVADHPREVKPALAWDTKIMTGEEIFYLNRLFTQLTSAPGTHCPAFEANVTEDIYQNTLNLVSRAGIMGFSAK